MRIPGHTPGPLTRADEKAALRRSIDARRVDLPDEVRVRAAQATARALLQHPAVSPLKPGAALVPSRHRAELDTTPLARTLEAAGWTILRPRAQQDPPRLDAVPWPTQRPLTRGLWGIPEPPPEAPATDPARLRLILVPGVAFDRSGHRIGTGAGYFDRFLAPLLAGPRPPLVIGVGYRIQLVAGSVPREAHDVPMHGLQLEDDSIVCHRAT